LKYAPKAPQKGKAMPCKENKRRKLAENGIVCKYSSVSMAKKKENKNNY